MKNKYEVGDLLSSGGYLFLVEEVQGDKYCVRATENDYKIWWATYLADKDQNLKKVN